MPLHQLHSQNHAAKVAGVFEKQDPVPQLPREKLPRLEAKARLVVLSSISVRELWRNLSLAQSFRKGSERRIYLTILPESKGNNSDEYNKVKSGDTEDTKDTEEHANLIVLEGHTWQSFRPFQWEQHSSQVNDQRTSNRTEMHTKYQ